MTNQAIRYMRRGKVHKSPLLIKHSNIKWLAMATLSSVFMVFISGYLLGYHKSETNLMTGSTRMALNVPEVPKQLEVELEALLSQQNEPVSSDAQASMEIEQPENADDRVVRIEMAETAIENSPAQKDTPVNTGSVVTQINVPAENVNEKIVESLPVFVKRSVEPPTIVQNRTSVTVPMGGPAPTDPGQDDSLAVLRDNATEETALYTLQVGIYRSLENAERRVEALREVDLNSYMNDYIGKSNRVLYNVRIGHYAGYRSASEALAMYQQEMDGTGYVVRFRR